MGLNESEGYAKLNVGVVKVEVRCDNVKHRGGKWRMGMTEWRIFVAHGRMKC